MDDKLVPPPEPTVLPKSIGEPDSPIERWTHDRLKTANSWERPITNLAEPLPPGRLPPKVLPPDGIEDETEPGTQAKPTRTARRIKRN